MTSIIKSYCLLNTQENKVLLKELQVIANRDFHGSLSALTVQALKRYREVHGPGNLFIPLTKFTENYGLPPRVKFKKCRGHAWYAERLESIGRPICTKRFNSFVGMEFELCATCRQFNLKE